MTAEDRFHRFVRLSSLAMAAALLVAEVAVMGGLGAALFLQFPYASAAALGIGPMAAGFVFGFLVREARCVRWYHGPIAGLAGFVFAHLAFSIGFGVEATLMTQSTATDGRLVQSSLLMSVLSLIFGTVMFGMVSLPAALIAASAIAVLSQWWFSRYLAADIHEPGDADLYPPVKRP